MTAKQVRGCKHGVVDDSTMIIAVAITTRYTTMMMMMGVGGTNSTRTGNSTSGR
jgi:hypothetical protein